MSARGRIMALLSALVLSVGISQAGESKLVRKTYSVGDLVIPVGKDAPGKTSEEQLIKLFTTTLAPDTWAEMGGAGTIEYFPQTYALVVNQTPEIQDQIQDLLQALRRLQDEEVATEVKLVEVSEEVFQDLKRLGLLKVEDPNKVSFLKDAEVRQLMERIQQDATSEVVQAPRVTAFNGQATHLDVTDEQRFVTGVDIRSRDGMVTAEPKTEVIPMGIRMSLRPTMSADRRFVRISLDLKLNSLVSDKVPLFPVTSQVGPAKNSIPDVQPVLFTQYIQQPRVNKLRVARTLVIPDGSTAVLTGLKKECEAGKKLGPEVLSKIPYIQKVYRKSGHCETHHVLVLVTPRIIVTREAEEKQEKAPEGGKKVTSCPGEREDFHTPVVGPVHPGCTEECESPSESRILRSLPSLKGVPGVYDAARDDVEVVTEQIVDRIDPPRFWPLIGPAQLHHSHWKCSVYCTETITGKGFPFAFEIKRPCIHEVYIDLDHLHLVNAEEKEKIK